MGMKVAIAQLRCAELDPAANRERTVAAIASAAAEGAELVVLPELASSGYLTDAAALATVAEPADGSGPVLGAWCRAAREHGVTVVGGFAERSDGRLYNSAVVIDAGGRVVGGYRKLHLYAAERDAFRPGDLGLPVFDLGGVRLGILICYDLRFVEALRILAVEGAQLVAVPAAWVLGYDLHRDPAANPAAGVSLSHVENVRAQANLDQVFVACADQVGRTDAHEFLGRSLVADPYGGVALGPLDAGGEAVRVVDIDPAEADRAHERGPRVSPRRDRRTDVYDDRLGYR
jgi:N-carbamoylputrescine amidase